MRTFALTGGLLRPIGGACFSTGVVAGKFVQIVRPVPVHDRMQVHDDRFQVWGRVQQFVLDLVERLRLFAAEPLRDESANQWNLAGAAH